MKSRAISLFDFRMIANEDTQPVLKRVSPRHPGFTVTRRWHFSHNSVGILVSILIVLSASSESIDLRLFVGTFPQLTGVYFVLFFICATLNIGFVLMAIWFGYKGQITPAMRERRWMKYLVLIGLLDGSNSFLIISSAHSSRVPPPLAAILDQSLILFIFLFSKFFLRKHYRWWHYLSVGLVLTGVILSLVPTFKRMSDGTVETELKHGWYWPFIYLIAYVPVALMRIVQEQFQLKFTEYARQRNEKITRFSLVYLKAVELTVQMILICALFELDLIPGFGTSKGISEWWTSFSNGFLCFFNVNQPVGSKCGYTALTGVPLGVCAIMTYLLGAFLTDHFSSTWLAILTSIYPVVTTSFWFIFPSVYRWAGGSSFSNLDIGCNVGALPIILIGIFLYRRGGTDRKYEENVNLKDETPHELFW